MKSLIRQSLSSTRLIADQTERMLTSDIIISPSFEFTINVNALYIRQMSNSTHEANLSPCNNFVTSRHFMSVARIL